MAGKQEAGSGGKHAVHRVPLELHGFRAYTEADEGRRHQAIVFAALKRSMHRFMAAPSGTRFEARYRRLHGRHHPLRAFALAGLGLLLVAGGLVLLVLPGPGILVAAMGAALIAGESKTAARWLDRVDLWLTKRWRRWRG
jgi:hypothetical protein